MAKVNILVFSVLALPLLSVPLRAQSKSGPVKGIQISVTDIEVTESRPRHNFTPVEGLPADTSSEWIRITAEYLAFPRNVKRTRGYAKSDGWLDSATFSWSVVIARSKSGNGRASPGESVLFTRDIDYVNIELDRRKKRFAVVYIEPRTIERFRDDSISKGIYVDLQVSVEDEQVASAWKQLDGPFGTSSIRRNFFPKSSEINWFSSDKIQRVQGGLLNRLETPWAWTSYGSYEMILQAPNSTY